MILEIISDHYLIFAMLFMQLRGKAIGADDRLAVYDTSKSVSQPTNMDIAIRGCFFKVDKSEMMNGISVSTSDVALRATTGQDNPKYPSTR